MVVELVGPAGAGKTTLARQIGSAHRDARTDVSLWGLPRPRLAAGALRVLPTVLASAVGAHPLSWDEIAQMTRLEALRNVVARAARCHSLVILDEGPVFALSWLDLFFARSPHHRAYSAWRRRTLSDWAALLDMVVLLDATDPSLARRIRARAKPHPVKDLSDAEIYSFTAGFRRAFERVVSDLVDTGHLAVASLDTDRDPAERHATTLLATLQHTANGN